MNMNKYIIIDAGHGNNSPGKRSPIWKDGKQLFEWEFNRDIATRIAHKLAYAGIRSRLLVTEKEDIQLSERCRRVNNICRMHGKDNCILISIHANAGGGTGFEVFTSPGNTKADEYATIMIDSLKYSFPKEKIRTDYSDGDADKEARFYMLQKSQCPAILTENLFMDNETDCRKLMDDDFREQIADAHVRAIFQML